jgi:hypothetical protein
MKRREREMSLFGEKCVRCGERTRERHDLRPVCPACYQSMQLMMIAANEAKRICPVDGAQLAKQIAHMLVIDRCPTCGGIWLDNDELERINSEVASEAMMAVARAAFPGV